MTAEAKTKLDAINAEAAQTTDAGLGGTATTATGNSEGAYNVSVERDRDGTTVTVTVEGATDAADEDFEMAMDLGGGLTMHTRDGEMGMQEIAMVMTDIEAPKAVEFAKWQADAAGATPYALDVNPATSGGSDFQSWTVVAGTDNVNLPRIMANSFGPPTDGSSSVQHTFLPAANDADSVAPGNQPREAAMVAGSLNGADGTYTCNTGDGGANCTVTVNDKGVLTAISTGWIFTPAEGATSDQPDYDYLNYGFWLKKTTEDGVTEYDEVETFHMAVGMANSTGTIVGSASYDGSAVGVYVHNVLSEGGGMVESRTAGHFTADASLMAYIGTDNDVPVNKHNTFTGTINNFMLSGGEAQDWSVALKGTVNASFALEDGTANGGGTEGTVSGQFYGAADTVPGAVSGEFNANFSNGSVAGAFGARKE